jgi:hypothetical protein
VIGTSGSTLVPVDHQEVPFEFGVVVSEQRRGARSGAAVQDNHGGICGVRRSKPQPLLHSSDHDVRHHSHTAGDDVAAGVLERRRVNAASDGTYETQRRSGSGEHPAHDRTL